MNHPHSVSRWLEPLQQGDEQAVQKLWERYYQQLVNLARGKLGDVPRRMADEEDVVVSAFRSFCRGAEQNRFPQLEDRNDLWRVLVTITARKAVLQIRREFRQKRGGGQVRGESAFNLQGESDEIGIAQVVGDEPTPEFAVQVTEEYSRLLDLLEDETLESVAQWKMEGYHNDEIAQKLGCVPRTVERKLHRIRIIWEEEVDSGE